MLNWGGVHSYAQRVIKRRGGVEAATEGEALLGLLERGTGKREANKNLQVTARLNLHINRGGLAAAGSPIPQGSTQTSCRGDQKEMFTA